MGYPTQVGYECCECVSSVMDWCFALEPDATQLRVGRDLFRFGLIHGYDRMSGAGQLENAAIDIIGGLRSL